MLRLVLAFILLFPLTGKSQSLKPFIVDRPHQWTSAKDLSDYTQFFEETSDKGMSIHEIQNQRFVPFNQKRNERIDQSNKPKQITWLKFSLQNISSDTVSLLYFCNFQDKVELFDQTGKLLCTSGFISGIRGRKASDIVLLSGQDQTYWVKITTYYSNVLPIISTLYTQATYDAATTHELVRIMPLLVYLSILCGCFLFMSAYSGYHYWLLKDRAFLYYCIFSFFIFYNCLFNISNRFGISDFLSSYGFFLTAFAFYGLFISRMLNLRSSKPWAWKIIVILVGCSLIMEAVHAAEVIIIEPLMFIIIAKNHGVLVIITITASLVFTILSKSPIKKFLIVGISSLIIVGLIPVTINAYFNTSNEVLESFINYPPTFQFTGLVIENFCFAMALAYRARLLENEKNELQKNYSQQLEENLAQRTSEIELKSKELEAQKIKQLTAEFEQRITTTEMIALRAQMNPHFIFNCLNSIKLYTLENDSETAAEYLTKFSRLIRLVLENSQADKISLAAELETLQLYIDMETMRFKNKFSYHIHLDEEVDTEYIDVPPMLIQPYIENAIWHGLMHKEGAGTVTVNIHQANEHVLKVQITDDGIGRVKAAEYKSKSATRHKSFGMKINFERIALINQLSETNTHAVIEDLVDHEGLPAGTRVTLTIPI